MAAESFVAEIVMYGFNFAPKGYAFCNGQVLPISQNTALFSLLGTTYGGDGKSTFALPNLQNATPLGAGQGPGLSEYWQGQAGGAAEITLLQTEIPGHTHEIKKLPLAIPAGNTNNTTNPINAYLGTGAGLQQYAAEAPTGESGKLRSTLQLTPAGASQALNNKQPMLGINICIALQGIFPERP
ncbi:phage tail protein [Chitinophaga solisilvae]|uniref:phage tail protein n=1 Tax=Chitinophaga solisilvae TaxID=1233460 RepID=UPI001369246A|nr:tail fiber protein [Chitinophaga solisilvae]